MKRLRQRISALLHAPDRIDELKNEQRRLRERLESLQILTAGERVRQLRAGGLLDTIQEAEFQVFSQAGEDGIIQYLLSRVGCAPPRFIEFGVENYEEANTRFLLLNDNWSGLVMDGSEAHVEHIRNDRIYWRHSLEAIPAFIDRDNIDGLIRGAGFDEEVGLLSIDLDGNDYWVWERIESANPVIVICEYNSLFGDEAAATIPYDPGFNRHRAHSSGQYWGASLPALCHLGGKKGYAFVGCCSFGNNAFFVRLDRLGDLKPLTAREGFVEATFRDSRDESGNLTFLLRERSLELIRDLPLVDVVTGRDMRVADCVAGWEEPKAED